MTLFIHHYHNFFNSKRLLAKAYLYYPFTKLIFNNRIFLFHKTLCTRSPHTTINSLNTIIFKKNKKNIFKVFIIIKLANI